MNLDRNLILAAGLSLMVIVAFTLFFPPVKSTPPDQTMANATSVSAPERAVREAEVSAGGAADQGVTPAAEKPDPGRTVTVSTFETADTRDITIETDLVSAVLSTRGGTIKSWKLKDYITEEGQPLDMVTTDAVVMPTLVIPAGMNETEAANIPYSCESASLDITGGKPASQVVLTARSLSGDVITKTLVFDNSSYAFRIDVQTHGYDGFRVSTGDGFGIMTPGAKGSYGHVGYIFQMGEDVVRLKSSDLFAPPGQGMVAGIKETLGIEKSPSSYGAAKGWAGNTDNYFLAAIISEHPAKAQAVKGTTESGYVDMDSEGKTSAEYEFYAGPKEYDDLKQIGYGLELSVDFGFFAFIAKPLFYVLKYFFGLVGNYGWAIIILTVIIKVLFAPLTHKQQKSMKRMQKLQPLINELKEKHKGDPQKMNMEMMELYKKHKVNPLGGCLPMVIQLPVFFALYKVLYSTIELWHAPFMWWLKDLSAKDPYYILPVLMGVSMYLMQKMTPSTVEGAQAQIFKFMPVIMVVIFVNLPSGLLLYFTVSNVLQMAQQFYINRYSPDEA